MSESSPPRRADQTILPPPTIYDPAEDKETPPGTEPTGSVVLLLVGDADAHWAARTAMELCTSWARGGRRIVLADLHLENPVLHEAVGTENLEGVVDVFLYGASMARSARPVAGRGFYLVPAGTYTDDVEAIYHHPRWAKLVAGFREANAVLVLFAPADGAELAALSQWVSGVIVLGSLRNPSLLMPLALAEIPVRARLLQPADGGAPGDDAPLPVFEPSPVAPRRDAGLHLPPPPVRTPPKGRRIVFFLALLVGVIVLAVVGFFVGRLRPDLVPWPSRLTGRAKEEAAAPAAAPVAMLPAAPTRGGEPLPYSVQVLAFQSFPAARDELLRERTQGVAQGPVFISPEAVGGIVYYKILAGALPDTAAARRLKESLVSDAVVKKQDAEGASTLILSVPLAFQLSEYRSAEAAGAAADSLLARNIPAYAVPVPYSDDTRRWQLYAGAYRDTASSAPMRALLTSAGLTPSLVARAGLAATEGR